MQDLLLSIELALSGQTAKFVIVQQKGNDAVSALIQEFILRHKNSHLLLTDGSAKSVSANISFNRFYGYRFCFDELDCDYVIALEDDVVISSDFFFFTRYAASQYFDDKHFRGINYGSHEKYSSASVVKYQKIRFGIQGPASVITKPTWEKINSKYIQRKLETDLYDGAIEYFLKTGYMVTPECSRIIDQGVAGTHTSTNYDDPYFQLMRESFVEGVGAIGKKFVFEEKGHCWRNDSISYNPRDNWKYLLLYFSNLRNRNWIFRKLERGLYKLFFVKEWI